MWPFKRQPECSGKCIDLIENLAARVLVLEAEDPILAENLEIHTVRARLDAIEKDVQWQRVEVAKAQDAASRARMVVNALAQIAELADTLKGSEMTGDGHRIS